MEIRVYLSIKYFVDGKYVYCRRIEQVDVRFIDYSSIISTMRLLYGSACVVNFICVD